MDIISDQFAAVAEAAAQFRLLRNSFHVSFRIEGWPRHPGGSSGHFDRLSAGSGSAARKPARFARNGAIMKRVSPVPPLAVSQTVGALNAITVAFICYNQQRLTHLSTLVRDLYPKSWTRRNVKV